MDKAKNEILEKERVAIENQRVAIENQRVAIENQVMIWIVSFVRDKISSLTSF